MSSEKLLIFIVTLVLVMFNLVSSSSEQNIFIPPCEPPNFVTSFSQSFELLRSQTEESVLSEYFFQVGKCHSCTSKEESNADNVTLVDTKTASNYCDAVSKVRQCNVTSVSISSLNVTILYGDGLGSCPKSLKGFCLESINEIKNLTENNFENISSANSNFFIIYILVPFFGTLIIGLVICATTYIVLRCWHIKKKPECKEDREADSYTVAYKMSREESVASSIGTQISICPDTPLSSLPLGDEKASYGNQSLASTFQNTELDYFWKSSLEENVFLEMKNESISSDAVNIETGTSLENLSRRYVELDFAGHNESSTDATLRKQPRT